jgi:hypothetical protein
MGLNNSGTCGAADHLNPEKVQDYLGALRSGARVVALHHRGNLRLKVLQGRGEIGHGGRLCLESGDCASDLIHINAHNICAKPKRLDDTRSATHERIAYDFTGQIDAVDVAFPEIGANG